METPPEDPAEEVKRLRRCISDLVALVALPAVSPDHAPLQIVCTLLEMLLSLLDLDFVYVRLEDQFGEAPLEMSRVAHSEHPENRLQDVADALRGWLTEAPEARPRSIKNPLGEGESTIVPVRLGTRGEIGIIVAGCRREDFPVQTEKLVLDVAANQAVTGLQEARLLSEQQRAAAELDRRVAQRTADLAAANEELKRTETALRESEARTAADRRYGSGTCRNLRT
jgi:GAF domain-containing protein